jgi:iron complex outermembrane receptor protein
MANTDYKQYNFFYRSNFQKDLTRVDFQSGYQQKSFGAGGFYSPRFPDQYEETGTCFSSLKVSTGGTVKVNPMVYWLRKRDHFLLVRDNPAYYENYHLTDVYGSQLNISYSGKNYATTVGLDLRSENLLSNNIGLDNPNPKPVKDTDSTYYTKQYGRTNLGLFLEVSLKIKNLGITAGTMINWNTGFPGRPAFFPGIDLHYEWLHEITLYASINRALHLPTFTDLFYQDPVHEGNVHLDPDRLFSCEGGFKYKRNITSVKIACFYNSGNDIIDWLWSYSANRFSPVNLNEYRAWGISSNFTADFNGYKPIGKWVNALSVNYIYLNVDKSASDSVSKYYNLKHKLSLIIGQAITKRISISWNISYQNRDGEVMGYRHDEGNYFSFPNKPYWLIDGSVKCNFKWMQLCAEMTNILNIRYIDAGSAVQPGRWYGARVVVRFNS